MSQQQQDRFKALIGDGLGKVTIGRDLGEKDFGSGGGVFVNVTLTCDQSEAGLRAAIPLAYEIADSYVWHYQRQLKQQLLAEGILK